MLVRINQDMVKPMSGFTGDVVPDNSTVQQSIQALETSIEGRALSLFSHVTEYPDGSLAQSLKRFINAGDAPYNIRMNDTDETTKWELLLSQLTPGSIVIIPSGKTRITRTLKIGNGTSSIRSTLNSITFMLPMGCHVQAFIDSGSGIPKSGAIFEWYGAGGGTMMEWSGPIHGIKIIGEIQLDGRNLAGYGLRAWSFSYCDIDALSSYKCTIVGIDLDVRDTTSIGAEANGLTSAHNRIGHIKSFHPETPGSIALRIDGFEVSGGQDVTVTKIGIVMLGYSGDRGKGLWLGYSDFSGIDILITIPYGVSAGDDEAILSNRPSAMYIDGSSNPFDAPTTFEIRWFAANGQGKILGGTAGQVYIDNFSMDEGGALPDGVSGLNVRRIHSHSALYNGQSRGTYQKQTLTTIGDGDGCYLKDAVNSIVGSLTRYGSGVRLSSTNGAVELEPATQIVSQTLRTSTSYATDAAAAAAGVVLGGFYRNGSTVCIRIS